MCKFCLDTTVYEWRHVEGRWKLVNPYNGQVHECKRDKSQEISTQTPQFTPKDPPKKEQSWGEMQAVTKDGQMVGYQREGYFKCPKCPEGFGIFNKKDPDFKDILEIHNSVIHPNGQDWSWIDEKRTPQTPLSVVNCGF